MLTVSPSAISSPSPLTRVVTVVDSGAATSECHSAVRLLPTSPLNVTSSSSPVAADEAEASLEDDESELLSEALSEFPPHAARVGMRSHGGHGGRRATEASVHDVELSGRRQCPPR